MRFSFTAATLSALVGYSAAHTLVVDLHVNGKNIGDGRSVNGKGTQQYIRSPPSNSPVKDLKSADIVCNVNGGKAVKDFASLAAGDKVSFEWFHNTPGDDIIDLSHKGGVTTHIAAYTEDAGTGAIWTKIGEQGFSNGKWAVEALVANKGVSEAVTIPATLKPGKYLLRQEIIALHEADTTFDVNPARGAQFYPACVQVEITGTGSDVPPENFDFNTGYTYADPGIHFNLYSADASTYKIPGPKVWTGGAGSGSGSGSGSAPAPTSAASAKPTATAKPTTLATSVTSAAPVTTGAAAPVATPTKAPIAGCKRRRSLKARRSAH